MLETSGVLLVVSELALADRDETDDDFCTISEGMHPSFELEPLSEWIEPHAVAEKKIVIQNSEAINF
jgi:hypothetical protein